MQLLINTPTNQIEWFTNKDRKGQGLCWRDLRPCGVKPLNLWTLLLSFPARMENSNHPALLECINNKYELVNCIVLLLQSEL